MSTYCDNIAAENAKAGDVDVLERYILRNIPKIYHKKTFISLLGYGLTTSALHLSVIDIHTCHNMLTILSQYGDNTVSFSQYGEQYR